MLELSTENILLRKLRLAFLKIDDPRALHEPFVRKNRAVLDTFLTPVLFLRYGRASLERLVEKYSLVLVTGSRKTKMEEVTERLKKLFP
jgi:hypothetical protein